MFPEIVKKKKKVKIGTQQMQKQCQFVLKQIDFKHRKAIKSLPSQLVSDFHKVCHLKDIPQFYWQYFFYFVAQAPKQDVEKYFAQEVENIMLTKSYYHKISTLLREREQQLTELKQQMQVIEGFAIMNAGKQLPMTIKGKINSLINNCSSLQQLKSIESTQVTKITTILIKIRENLKEIIQTVLSWQFWLKSFNVNDGTMTAKKMKIIFPENGINCIFIGLYDMQFLKTSFLNQQIKFSNSQYDPFLTQISPHKRMSKIFQQHLFNPLVQNNEKYQKVQRYLFDCIPLPQTKQQQDKIEPRRAYTSQKKFNSVQRPSSKKMKRSNKKLLDQYVSAKLITEKPELKINPTQSKLKQINIDQITSIYKKKRKSKNEPQGQKSQMNQKSLNKSRQKSIQQLNQRSRVKSVILFEQKQQQIKNESIKQKKSSNKKSVQKLEIRPNSMSKTLNSNMKKIEIVYKLSSTHKKPSITKINSARQTQVKDQYLERVLRQKDELIRQLKNQKKQQQQLKKIIKQVQHRTSNQQKNFQQKTQYYQKQIQALKSKIKQRQSLKHNELQKDQKQHNPNKLVTKVYQHKGKQSQNQTKEQKEKQKQSPQQNLAKSQLVQKINTNKMLENKIKQLAKQKTKLQKLIEKQGTKVNKQKEIYQRKLQKYQQIIDKLKNQASQSKNLAYEFQKKYSLVEQTVKKQERQQKIMKLYSKKQALSPQKVKKSQQKIIVSQFKKDEKQQRQKHNKSPIQQDLRITNNRNTIQIVYNLKKNKKTKKQPQIIQNLDLNKSVLKEKQKQYEKQMQQLAKQKSLLQRKLDMRINEKSGHEIMLMRKLQQSEEKFQKYRMAMQKQKQTTVKYDQKMRQLRKKINQQYEQKIQRQRQRFEKQRQRLLQRVKEQKESKLQKDRYLSRQMLFLKEMEMREKELVGMLERQRLERQQRQRLLQQQIRQRQQMLQKYELQEIKRVIEKQVREQMQLLQQQQEKTDEFYDMKQDDEKKRRQFEIKKQQLQQQMREIMANTQIQLEQIDEQNERLKQLITKIKQEEKRVILSLERDIVKKQEEEENYNNGDNDELQLQKGGQVEDMNKSRRINQNNQQTQNNQQKTQPNDQIKNQPSLSFSLQQNTNQQHQQTQTEKNHKVTQQLQNKSKQQLQKQQISKSRLKLLQQSTQYKQRQKLQNIIQKYLQKPNHYPFLSSNTLVDNKNVQNQRQIQKSTYFIINKNIQQERQRKARQFQQQLMQLKNIQNFIPAQRDDPLMKNLLHLRQQYQDQQAQQLRKVLFPSLGDDDYNNNNKLGQFTNDLSFQSSQPPAPVTLKDHVNVHEQQYLRDRKEKKSPSKNFMAINRMRLMQIQQQKKEKQRLMIEEQAKKKIKRIRYKSKKKQQKQLQEFNKIKEQLVEKQRRRQQEIDKGEKLKSKQKINKQKNKQIDMKQQQKKSNQMKKEDQTIKIKDKKKHQQSKLKVQKKQQKLEQKQDEGLNQFLTVDQVKIKNNSHKQVQKIEKDIQLVINRQSLRKQVVQSNNDTNKQQVQMQKKTQQQFQFVGIEDDDKDNNNNDNNNKNNNNNNENNNNNNKQQAQYQQQYDDEQFESQFQQQSQQKNNYINNKQNNQVLNELKDRLAEINKQHKKQQQQNQVNKNYINSNINDTNRGQQQQQQQQIHRINNNINNNNNPLPPISNQQILKQFLQQQKQSLKQDILSYQSQIRSYISSYTQYTIYQHFIQQKQLQPYLKQLTELSSQQIIHLNNNHTLNKDLSMSQSIVILIAKDQQTKLQIGIGLFHKQYQHSQYICDYLLAHDMNNFLPLVFNFTRFIFQNDLLTDNAQFIFTVNSLKQQQSKTNFAQFENKCKRLGQIYVKGKQQHTRKYVLKRQLFEQFHIDQQQIQKTKQQKPLKIKTKLQIHQNIIKQKKQINIKNYSNQTQNFTSPTFLLSLYLKNNPTLLQQFKSQIQQNLKYRELLLTSMIFAKKQFNFKTLTENIVGTKQKIDLYQKLSEKFQVDDVQQKVQQLTVQIQEELQGQFKKCVLQMNQQDIKYCMFSFTQPLNRCQASNSSQTGTFLPLIPKYKMLIIPADQFLTLSQSNPDMNVFFYTKHFIKNITQVKKESISRVFLPQIKLINWTFYKELSQKMKKTIFGQDEIKIGYESNINNSVIYTPRHSDLVFEKPFIVSVLSANVQRTVEGSPIFCTLIH